jgi:hypothetical protein
MHENHSSNLLQFIYAVINKYISFPQVSTFHPLVHLQNTILLYLQKSINFLIVLLFAYHYNKSCLNKRILKLPYNSK